MAEFLNIFTELTTLYQNSIILGDFNDLPSNFFDTDQSHEIKSFINSMNLFFILFSPTYHTRASSVLMDLCIVDDSDKFISYNQQDVCFLSAHELIDVEYKIKIDRQHRCLFKIRDYRLSSIVFWAWLTGLELIFSSR